MAKATQQGIGVEMWRFLWRWCFPFLICFVIGRASAIREAKERKPIVIWKDCKQELKGFKEWVGDR